MTLPSVSRDFKGIWIPRDLWLDQSLNYFERCLFAELHSLDGEQGCYASNEYLCNFFNERERKIQDGLSKLKAKGLISCASFDGRKRVIKTHPEIYQKPDKHNLAPLPCENPELYKHNLAPLPCQKSTPAHYIEKKENTKETTRPPLKEIEKIGGGFGQDQATGISYRTAKAEKKYISEGDLIMHFLREPFTTEVLQEAIKIARAEVKPINDILKYYKALCVRLSAEKSTLPKKDKNAHTEHPPLQKNISMDEYWKSQGKENPFKIKEKK